jgi:hypothetical protein
MALCLSDLPAPLDVVAYTQSLGSKTEMTLRHERFESNESRDSHNQGWNASLERLAEVLAL